MIPMIDTVVVPGLATFVVAVGPALLGVAIVMVVGVAWATSEVATELRRPTSGLGVRPAHAIPVPGHRIAA